MPVGKEQTNISDERMPPRKITRKPERRTPDANFIEKTNYRLLT